MAHVSEFSWVKKVNNPKDMFKVGDEVKCMILGYNLSEGKISLGIKQVQDNPWDTIDEKYPVGTELERPIVKIIICFRNTVCGNRCTAPCITAVMGESSQYRRCSA